jgi:hypothetical protein
VLNAVVYLGDAVRDEGWPAHTFYTTINTCSGRVLGYDPLPWPGAWPVRGLAAVISHRQTDPDEPGHDAI